MGRLAAGAITALFILVGCTSQPTVQPVVEVDKPFVVVLPHHQIVQTQRQELLATVSQQHNRYNCFGVTKPFSTGQAGIQTTDRTWTLEMGPTDFSNTPVIQQLWNLGWWIMKILHLMLNMVLKMFWLIFMSLFEYNSHTAHSKRFS